MWVAVLIGLIICYALYRLARATIKPIVDFVYWTILDLLMATGMSLRAAKALISLAIIIAIISLIMS